MADLAEFFNSNNCKCRCRVNFRRPESELSAHRSSIERFFRDNPPYSAKEAGAEIENLTGIRRSDTQVRKFLKRIGMRRLKIGTVPAKADVEVQEEFVKKNSKRK